MKNKVFFLHILLLFVMNSLSAHAFSEDFEESIFDQIREEYQIQQDENVVLVMLEGNSAKAALIYAKLLLRMRDYEIDKIVGRKNQRNKIRLICLCGDVAQEANQMLMVQLNGLNESKNKSNARVIIHACPSTPQIAELVSLPELRAVVSRPSESIVNEMIKRNVPMIYHVSYVPRNRERRNMEHGFNQGVGRPFCISEPSGNKVQADLVSALSYVFAIKDQDT